MLNQIIMVGRLTHDAEVKILEDGRKVAEIHLAIQRSFKNMEGEYDTDFIKCSAWEGIASHIESYAKKGVLVAVRGRVQTRKYELQDDKKLNMLEIICDRISYLASSKQDIIKQYEESSRN